MREEKSSKLRALSRIRQIQIKYLVIRLTKPEHGTEPEHGKKLRNIVSQEIISDIALMESISDNSFMGNTLINVAMVAFSCLNENYLR